MSAVLDGSLLTVEKVCQKVGISKQGLYRMIRHGQFPRGIKIGRLQKWLPDTIDDHLVEMSNRANKVKRR